MKRGIRWSIRIAVAVALVGAVAWALRPPPILVQTATVTRGALEATVTAEGRTRVRDLFVVTAPVDGELERIQFKAGDTVSAATVIARMRPVAPRPLDIRSRAEALAAVAAARAAIERAEAAQKEAVGALTHAESQFATARSLSSAGAVPAKDFEHAGHEVEIRRQAVQASRAALDVARADLVRAEAAAATAPSADQPQRPVAQVRSPASGRILRVLRESAGPVSAGTPLVELGNVGAIEIVADFLTTDAVSVSPGASATILDWGGAQALAARVRQVEAGGFTKVSALGLEEQRVPIVLDLAGERPAALGNDFHVNVAIVVWAGHDVLTVPSTALFRVGESWAVFVVHDGRALLRRVVVGRSDDTRSVIEEGLDVGDDVVVQPSDALQDGSRVATPSGHTGEVFRHFEDGMDTAVALVQAYLNTNGYFTVVEYPVLESSRHGPARSVTDLDVLAVRFAGSGHEVIRRDGRHPISGQMFATDPALGCSSDRPDMIVGEVKEGAARFNPATRNPEVLQIALARFGCCHAKDASELTRTLLARGRVDAPSGHTLRMVAFGSVSDTGTDGHWHTVPMAHVVNFLRGYLHEHWDVLRHAQIKDPTIGLLALLEKWGVRNR